MGSNSWEMNSRRASRKRRRLSERRRLFGRIGLSEHQLLSGGSQMSSSDGYDNYQTGGGGGSGWSAATRTASSTPPRSDSPLGIADGAGAGVQKVSMKIQFHIAVAPQNEPLIVDTNCAAQFIEQQQQQQQQQEPESPSISSINEQIQDKLRLSRQSSSSTKRRQQLLAMHSSSTNDSSAGIGRKPPLKERASLTSTGGTTTTTTTTSTTEGSSSTDPGTPISSGGDGGAGDNLTPPPMMEGREPGARSSTISGGMADEATLKFLQADRQRTRRPQFSSALNLSAVAPLGSSAGAGAGAAAAAAAAAQLGLEREHIYFKRDGQRFGHEFTLKLAVDRTYRCLLKVRPLMPLESISVQGHQVLFVDCSQQADHQGNARAGGSAPGSAAGSTLALNHQQQQQQHQRLRSGSAVLAAGASPASRHASQPVNDAYLNKHRNHHHYHHHHLRNNHHQHNNSSSYSSANRNNNNNNNNNYSNHLRSHPISKPDSASAPGGHRGQLHHAQTTASLYRPPSSSDQNNNNNSASKQLAAADTSCSLYRQQQNQMMRHFAASYCSTSNSHLGNQLIYMFDWPASRFEVNRNKNRTEIHTVLKFENGQIISLPLQVKFYPSDCRQHLEWGSQLHFIDYDCQLNQLGQISVDRIQYY